MNLDMTKLEPLLGMMVNELGAAANAALVLIGDKLGLYRTLASSEPLTPGELAEKTGTHERYLREWLSSQAASGFVTYDERSGRFALSPEQAAVFADEESPVYMAGGFYSLAAVFADEPKLTEAFKTGRGVGWGEHCNCLFCGTERFFRPGYKAHLVTEWLPALDGIVEKLERGAKIADVGCGHGASTIIMAEAFPKSEFVGIDFHEASIVHAREHAKGLANVRFETARAQDFAGSDYDLVTIFDALHDMGDPVGAVAHVRETLKPDGTLMLVEPRAGDSLEENLNPVGRIYYAFSTSVCVPASLGQEVGAALGAQAGEKRLADVVGRGGFSRFRRAADTPFNMVLEARP
ncbi:methyltransferase domain-containing protein [Sinorhizobium numidicum]|uniref:Methyltransferase domain-containing protein n=1 Tax=Sinorhizobium numidicum TaxID=680248 RepID=A0ABY8CMP8_9HYPH|nr:class I SAM-dependent methyltransferase [Sinorhizobium numidicum]WEX73955.1 methyltransferase domain-containing protein [Sinorhizobium numidicum]WEX79940.1 methyltransferase domain-containing protein [Sinorhizobium numidicum]